MNVFIVGGTGLLGLASAVELIERNHKVRSVALPSLPSGIDVPPQMEIVFGNYITMTDDELKRQLKGCDALVFAAGVDERVEFPAPVFEQYKKYNIEPVERFLRLAKEVGIKKTVIMGSYFAYFAKKWQHLHLTEKHPYIRSRILQEEIALAFNDEKMSVMVLELPYIFGAQQGRKPVWTFLVEIIRKMKYFTFYMQGGTTMVTVKQVAQTVAGALERGKGGVCYPVGWYNMKWSEMLTFFHNSMGIPKRKIITVPTFLIRLGAKRLKKMYVKKGIEPGLDPVEFIDVQTAETFIDKSVIRDELGVADDDINTAIGNSVKLCLDVLDGKTEVQDMKAE